MTNLFSRLEEAEKILKDRKNKININELIDLVFKNTNTTPTDELKAQLYIDISTSSNFVYLGNEEWDLKAHRPLKDFDKDGADFLSKDELYDEDDEEVTNFQDDEDDDLDNEYDDNDDNEEYSTSSIDDEDDLESDYDGYDDSGFSDYERDDEGNVLEKFVEDDFDEDKYNDYMDDFEDMYDE